MELSESEELGQIHFEIVFENTPTSSRDIFRSYQVQGENILFNFRIIRTQIRHQNGLVLSSTF